MSESECLIREVRLKNERIPPLIVSFEHGSLKAGKEQNMICGVFCDKNRPEQRFVAAVPPAGDIVYCGPENEESTGICHTFIAVRNKRSNKIRLIEASDVMLSPNICGNKVTESDTLETKEADYNLSHAFGSKKARRVADLRERMSVNVDVIKDKLSTTVNDVEVSQQNLGVFEDTSLAELLPPCNRQALEPREVYRISDLLTPEELESLESYAVKLAEGEELDMAAVSPFYKAVFKRIPISPFQIRHSALLLYAESLIQFCNMKESTFKRGRTNVCPFSESVSKRIVEELTVKRLRSSMSVDKAIMRVIILTLHVNDFVVDLDLLASSIKFADIKKIKLLASVVGTVPHPVHKQCVVLKVPLPRLPSKSMNRSRTRR